MLRQPFHNQNENGSIRVWLLAGVAAFGWAGTVHADQDYIKAQPIQVNDSAGANCATVTLDKAASQQLFNKAGIVPEPTSLAVLMLPMGLAGLTVARRKRDTAAV